MSIKKCKGKTKSTKGYGCGKALGYSEVGGIKTYYSKYGLCLYGNNCYGNWLQNSIEGQEMIIKASRKAKMYSVNKVSTKRQKESVIYSKLRIEFLKENTICFIDGCNSIADTIEHTKGRGINYLKVEYWKPCCLKHNLELENNPAMAQKYQLSKLHNGKKIVK